VESSEKQRRGSHGAVSDDSTCCGSLVVYLVDWLVYFDILTDLDGFNLVLRGFCLTHLSFTHSFKLEFCLLLPSRWFSWCTWHACVPLRCRDVALPLLGQSPKVSTLSFSTPWSPNSLSPYLGLQALFLSSFSNRSSPRRYYANSPRIW